MWSKDSAKKLKNYGKMAADRNAGHPCAVCKSSFIRQVCVVREMGGWYNGERYSGVVSRKTEKM